MYSRFLLFVAVWLTLSFELSAKKKKAPKFNDKKNIETLKADIYFLASDSLEGRRTGSKGESIAASYIQQRFQDIGIAAYKNNYLHEFEVKEKYTPTAEASFLINENEMTFNTDYAPLPFSGYGEISSLVIPNITEADNMWLVAASKISKEKPDNPHAEALAKYLAYALKAQKEKCTGLIIYNNMDSSYDFNLKMNLKDTSISIPVVYVNHAAAKQFIEPNLKKDWIDFSGKIELQQNIRRGKNVAAYIDNQAAQTVIIGAHYDHLGYGEDHNSMYTGKDKAIHNGADDNASGTAAMLSLADLIKKSGLNSKNYLFCAFSGEELGLYGSKQFAEENISDTARFAYMINIDMLGRFNDSSKGLTVGGAASSPQWIPTLEKLNTDFVLKYDSSGVGPSDHTSFYLKNMPVLFYFTGLHSDYHKPSDDADKINYEGENKIIKYMYELVKNFDNAPKPTFTKTKEQSIKSTAFKVTLGIMPDYTFNGPGVKADGVSDNRPAQKAGIQAGDVIIQLGDYKISDMQTYMEALGKFKKGDKSTVTLKRKNQEISLPLSFD